KRGKVWYYRFVGPNGEKVERKGCADKKVTLEMARAAETGASSLRNGLVTARDLSCQKNAPLPLAVHLDEWRANLVNAGKTPKHADQSADRVRRLVAVMFGANP